MKRHTGSLTARSLIRCGIVALPLLGALACQDVATRELGYTDDDALDLTAAPDEPTEPFTTDPREFAGRWIGEAQESLAFGVGDGAAPAYRFPSGSTSIVLDIQLEDDPEPFTANAGTIVFGAGSEPPPPTDPDRGYPTEVDYLDVLGYFPSETPTTILRWTKLPPHEGFTYPLAFIASEADFGVFEDFDLVLPDGVMKLQFSTADVLAPWCELQTAYAHPDGNYSCIPWHNQVEVDQDGSCTLIDLDPIPGCPDLDILTIEEIDAIYALGGPPEECNGSVETPVATLDCNKVALCENNHCSCIGGYCFPGLESSATISLRRSGDTLVGEIDQAQFLNARGLGVPLGTLRFRRAP